MPWHMLGPSFKGLTMLQHVQKDPVYLSIIIRSGCLGLSRSGTEQKKGAVIIPDLGNTCWKHEMN